MHGYIGGKRGHVTFSSRIVSEGLMNITAADVDIMAAGEFGGEGIMIGDDSKVNIMGDDGPGGKREHVTFSSMILSEGLMNITGADVDIMAARDFGGEGNMIDDDSQVNIMGDGVAEGQRGHVKFTSPRRQPRRVYHLRRRMSFGSAVITRLMRRCVYGTIFCLAQCRV